MPAVQAIKSVLQRSPYDGMEKHDAVVRLLVDLRHWCRAERVDIRSLLAESAGVYIAEETKGEHRA